MKRIYILTIGLFFCILAHGQNENWLWSKGVGGSNGEIGQNIATDQNGNIYVVGSFSSPTLTFGTYTLTNAGMNDVFLTKYDSLGNVLWAVKAGGSGDDQGFGVCTEKNWNVIIVGNFASSQISFGNITLTNPGYFICKYNSGGTPLWAHGDGGQIYHNSYGNPVACDTNSNIGFVGTFISTIQFDGFTLNNTGGTDIFTVKYNASGSALWVRQGVGGNGEYDNGNGLTFDKQGNVFITGYAGSNTVFGNWSTGTSGIYIVKYLADGTFSDLKCTNGGTGIGITVDGNGTVYVAGTFTTASLTFGGQTVAYNANPGTCDILLVTYSNPPNVWSVGGAGLDQAFGIATDSSGNIYVSGSFRSSSVTFPPSTTLTNSLTGSADPFVVKYIAGFNFNLSQWARSATGENDQEAYCVAAGKHNHVYATGSFAGNPAFDYDTLISAGGLDIWTAELGCEPLQPQNIVGPGNVCRYSTHNYTVNPPVPGATSYIWTLASGWSGSSTSNSISVTFDSTSGNITVRAVGSCSAGEDKVLHVIVNPVTPTISPNGPTSFCSGNSVLLTSSPACAYLWSNGATTQTLSVNSAGNYSITITNQDGCIATSLPTQVTVFPSPPVPTITQVENVLISTAGAGNQWYFNGNPIAGQTGQVLTPTQNGLFSVMIMDGNGCTSMSAPYNFIFVGLENSLKTLVMNVFPNPSFGKFILSLSEEMPGIIKIVNQIGQIIYTGEVNHLTKTEIDISTQPDGIYILRFQTEENTTTRKIIKTQSIK
jgi:hypothetical protein